MLPRSGRRGAGVSGGYETSALLVFTASLDDGPEDIGGLARRGDQIEGTVVKRVEILVPIGETGGHDDAGMIARLTRCGHHIAIVAIGEPAVAENQGDILRFEGLLSLPGAGRTNRVLAFLAENGVQNATILQFPRHDKGLRIGFHY